MKYLLVLSILLGAFGLLGAPAPVAAQPQNVILFISDGCGPASFTLARGYKEFKGWGGLTIDDYLVGSARTFAADSRVTDSAASGTAMACGVKTNNGVIAMDTTGMPVATVLEAAELRGMATGLVVTSTISHATPATFSSHVASRSEQPEIARQQLEQGIEVLFGGGEEFYLPESDGGRREDALNLFALAAEKGYHVARSRDEFLELDEVPALGIFGDGHMTYEIDRDTTLEPSLAEMTRRAIELLDDDPNGFFLMVEGSRIDHAGHTNDVAAHLHEILQFDEAFAAAVAYAAEHGNTIVASTSDHETGGMSLGRTIAGRPVYGWWPEVLDRVPASVSRLVDRAEESGAEICGFLEAEAEISCSVEDSLAIQAGDSLNAWEKQRIVGEIISRSAGIGWTSSGHTAVDVNVYAYGPGSEIFAGHQDNTMIGRKIAEIMDFDLDAITASLRNSPQ